MKTIIIAVERSKFNYLYKYNICTVSSENIINFSLLQLSKYAESSLGMAASTVESALPIFESEHEVILLEVDESGVKYNLQFNFSSVRRIIPLNELALELLQSKLNPDFQYAPPIPSNLYQAIFSLREDKVRSNSASSLLSCFELPTPSDSFIGLVRDATRRVILNEEISKGAGTIDYLLEFNTTPSGIPNGYIEGLMKIICVGMLKHNGSTNKLRQSTLFNLLLDNLESINQGPLLSCYRIFQKISNENKGIIENLEKTLSFPEVDSDLFLFLFLFISFKKEIQDNDFNLKSISLDVGEIRPKYIKELSQALYLIGYTMSMGKLHESIHRMASSPMFGGAVGIKNKEFTTDEVAVVDANTTEAEPHEVTDNLRNSELPGIGSAITDRSSNNSGNVAVIVEKDEPSASGNPLEVVNQREKLLEEAKQKLNGAYSKAILTIVNDLYKDNSSFSYDQLEESIRSSAVPLNKGEKLKKVAEDLLIIFKPLG